MLERGFMGIFDIKTDRVALAMSSGTNASSIGFDLRPRRNLPERILSVVSDVRPGEGMGAIPSVLISGTAAGMFAGFGLVHLPAASDFRASLLMLAVMDVCVSFLLLFHKDNGSTSSSRSLDRKRL